MTQEELEEKVEAFYDANLHQEIINLIDEVERTDENTDYLDREIGRAYNNLGEYQEALDVLLPLDKKENHSHSKTNYRIAYAYCYLSEYDEALAYANKGIELDPEYASGYQVRGEIHRKLYYLHEVEESFAQCEADFLKDYELDPEDNYAFYWLGKLYQTRLFEKYNEADFNKSVSYFNQYLELDPEDEDCKEEIQKLNEFKEFNSSFNVDEIEIPTPEIPMQWTHYYSKVGESPASIRTNLGLRSVLPLTDFPDMLWFAIRLNHPDQNGFAGAEEFERINAIEDALVRLLEDNHSIFAGTMMISGRIDLFFYCHSAHFLIRKIEQLMEEFEDYSFISSVERQPDSGSYLNYLYPNKYEYRTILNRMVLNQLLEKDDDLEKERNVDHWVDFRTDEALTEFIHKIIDEGYRVLGKQEGKEGEFPLSVNIVKSTSVTPNIINRCTWDLMDLADEYGGSYDGWGCPLAE